MTNYKSLLNDFLAFKIPSEELEETIEVLTKNGKEEFFGIPNYEELLYVIAGQNLREWKRFIEEKVNLKEKEKIRDRIYEGIERRKSVLQLLEGHLLEEDRKNKENALSLKKQKAFQEYLNFFQEVFESLSPNIKEPMRKDYLNDSNLLQKYFFDLSGIYFRNNGKIEILNYLKTKEGKITQEETESLTKEILQRLQKGKGKEQKIDNRVKTFLD